MIPLPGKSIGDNTFVLFAVDEKSAFVTGVSIKSKSKLSLLDGFKTIIATFNAHGHKVLKITTDDEKNFLSTKDGLATYGIQFSSTPAGFHEKRAERYIQTLKSRIRATLAQLSYKLPVELYAEAYICGMHSMNITCNKVSGDVTPYQLVTHTKPFVPQYSFGETGVFHSLRDDSSDTGEWGIFLNHGTTSNYYRAYLPLRHAVYSKRKFIPEPTYPPELKLLPRLISTKQKVATITPPMTNDSTLSVAPPRNNLLNQEGELQLNRNIQTGQAISPPTQEGAIDLISKDSENNDDVEMKDNNKLIFDDVPLDNANITHNNELAIENKQVDNQHSQSSPTKSLRQSITPSPQPKIVTTPTKPQQHVSTRPTRAARNFSWKDGPAKDRTSSNDPAVNMLSILMTKSTQNSVYRMSLQKALKQPGRIESVSKAIEGEIDNMENGKVVPPVHYKDIPPESRDAVIDLHMFLKDKFKSNGSFDKTKARLVFDGSKQTVDQVGDTTSPTVNPISVFVILNFAACHSDYLLSAYDFKFAFLIPFVKPEKKIYVRIRKDIAQRWVEKYPYRKQYLTKLGNMYGLLLHNMYGMQEASKEFNDLLDEVMKSFGFEPTKADPCLYVKHDDRVGTMMAAVHVDDILLVSPNIEQRTWFENAMKERFELVSQYDSISYLGMSITRSSTDGSIKVVQDGFVKDILKKTDCSNLSKFPSTPATDKLYESDSSSSPCNKTTYLSLTMTLMYLARFTRPDILMPISYLATRSANPTQEDYTKLLRIVRYIAGTHDVGIHLKPSDMKLRVYADASHCTHPDGRGQAGMVITLGSGPIFSRSYKIKCTTRSSSESELYALEDASTYVIWLRCLLRDLRLSVDEPTNVYQDNQSTIIMAVQGGNFKRTKHLICKDSFVKERLHSGEMKLQYLPTTIMPADMLTKPLSKTLLNRHMNKLFIMR